jgi:signal transduction histidine kinase/CheY-like chemotaxis protein
MRRSLRVRALVLLCGTAVLSAALGLAVQDLTLSRDLARGAEQRVGRSARAAGLLVQAHLQAFAERWRSLARTPQLRAALEVDDAPTLSHFADSLREREGAQRVLFVGSHGRVLGGSGEPVLDAIALRATDPVLVEDRGRLFAIGGVALETAGPGPGRLVVVEAVRPQALARWSELCGARVEVGGAPTRSEDAVHAQVSGLGSARLWVTASLAHEREAQASARRGLIGAGAVSLAAALIVGFAVARGLVAPIRTLKVAAERIGAGDLAARVSLERRDEIGDLAASWNEMATRLEGQRAALERGNAELLLEKERALAASRAKSDFLANVSHEIRTPLGAMLGYAELVEERVRQDADAAEWMAGLRRNGEHLLRLVDDVLDVSKIEAGALHVELGPCAPMAIVEEALEMLRGRARERGLALAVEYASAVPERIVSDAARLRQILVNLIGNAIKFTERGGVELVVRLETAAAVARLVFEVIDTGIGIAPDYLRRMFEPFSQADTSTTRRFGGTGLGLAISRRLVQRLGGEIECESEPGRGSRFRFWVDPGPLEGVALVGGVAGPTGAAGESPARPVEAPCGRVLLAEDSPDNQRLVRTILQRAGHHVEVVSDGECAVAAALAACDADAPFDVVLMDMQMPVLDGYGATRRLRAAGYAGVIVALTAHAMQGDREKCLNAGCDDFATKPIARAELVDVIARHLRKPGGHEDG